MFKHSIHSVTGLLLALALAACATAPELSREQVLAENEQIARLEAELNQARARGAEYLAPEGFNQASNRLDEAVDAAARGERGAADDAARNGLATLQEVEQDVAQSEDLLREVLQRRERALDAGAANLYSRETAELEERLRQAGRMVEQGQLEDAKQRRADLIGDYEQLELKALKQGTVEGAEAAVEQARENDAERHAPKTFKRAREELDLARSVIEADRTDVARAEDHAQRARWLAERSIGISELVKDFDRRNFTQEDVVLWYQDQLRTVARPLNQELPFDEGNREVVSTLEQAVEELIAQRDQTAVARSRYEQELAQEAGREHTLEEVQAMFSAFEADVYQKQGDLLISAHGLQFPPGGSELRSENYGLLNKISTAIESFPDSTIRVTGHTDSTGGDDANMALSERRAESVASFLSQAARIEPQRIIVEGMGESRPVASNETEEGRAANRRVEILIDNPGTP